MELGNLGEVPFRMGEADAPALVEVDSEGANRAFSFGALKTARDDLAAELVRRGVSKGDRVALVGDNSAEHLIALLGILKAGAVACLINTKLSPDDRAELIAETDSVFTLADSAFLPDKDSLALDQIGALPPSPAPNIVIAAEDLAVIMFTSGSSGLPKGVPITHGGYGWALEQFLSLRDTMSGEAGIVAAPLFHMNGQFHVLNMMSVGARVVLMTSFSATGMLDAIAEFGVKRVTGVPTMAALMAEAIETGYPANSTASVAQVGLGSSPLSVQLLARIQKAFPAAVVTNGFGTTETGPVSFSAHPDGIPTPPTSLGYPMAGVDLKLVGGDTSDEGVLHIRNPMTLKGYWKRPDASAVRLDANGWYNTGDRMRRDDKGFYYFAGRADDMMQVGAENVYPAEVERRLEAHSDVMEAVVVSVPHAVKNEAPVAFVITKGGVSEDELKAFTIETGPAYAHPRRIFFVDTLPLASTNKIDRKSLEAQARSLVGGGL